MWLVKLARQAQKDAQLVKGAGLDSKVGKLIAVIRCNPFETPPAFEALTGNLQGCYSRRITQQHRLVYEVIPGRIIEDEIEYEGALKVLRMWTHYEGLGRH